MAERAAKEAAAGRKLPGRKPAADSRKGKDRHANTTDPDSRMLRARNRFVQGYNTQAAVSEDHLIVAADVTNAANDTTCFEPLAVTATENLAAAGAEPVGIFVADAGYWSTDNASLNLGAEVLIAPVPPRTGSPTPPTPASPSDKRCWPDWPPGISPQNKPPTPNARSPSNRCSGTSRRTCDSDDSPGEASLPSPVNGGSSAPPTTSSSSDATRWTSPDGTTGPRPTQPRKIPHPSEAIRGTAEIPATASHLLLHCQPGEI
jgi:hypothetical protein